MHLIFSDLYMQQLFPYSFLTLEKLRKECNLKILESIINNKYQPNSTYTIIDPSNSQDMLCLRLYMLKFGMIMRKSRYFKRSDPEKKLYSHSDIIASFSSW